MAQPAPAPASSKIDSASAGKVASILVLVGAILLIVLGALGVLGSGFSGARYGLDVITSGGILTLVFGVVALVLHKSLGQLAIQVVLLVIGLLAGGLGGTLVLLGALIALIVGLL